MDFSKLDPQRQSDRWHPASLCSIFSFLPWYGIDRGRLSVAQRLATTSCSGSSRSSWPSRSSPIVAITSFGDQRQAARARRSPWGLALLIAAGLAAFLVMLEAAHRRQASSSIDLDRKYGIFLADPRRPRAARWQPYLKFREGGATTTGRSSSSGPATRSDAGPDSRPALPGGPFASQAALTGS